jgi:hypothetical protein
MSHFCQVMVWGPTTGAPVVQATGKKYTIVDTGSGIAGQFKVIGTDAEYASVASGDTIRAEGKMRWNSHTVPPIADATANAPYSPSLVETPGGPECMIVSATGKCTTALTTLDADHKYFIIECDTDAPEAKVILKCTVSNAQAALWVSAGTQPVVNSDFSIGGCTLRKVSSVWIAAVTG